MQQPARVNRAGERFRHWVLDTPLLWSLAALCGFGWYAQFIPHPSWNAIELIIAQNLLEHGRFATSLDYPSAITWRPVLPTLVVTLLRLLTDDPLTIYRIFCAAAVCSLTTSLFLIVRRLFGRIAGHVAAALALTCPAATTYLVQHAHSYSHWGAMLILGPALLSSARLIIDESSPKPRDYRVSGLLWGLAYLSRSEMLLFAGLAFLALVASDWRRRRVTPRSLAAWLLPFVALFGTYNILASVAAARDDILIRKTIYTFYISQGWVDPAPWTGPDIEADGYRYAIELYGEPTDNDESLLRAIRRNPEAFARRVQRNAVNFYQAYRQPWFFATGWMLAALAMVLILLTGRIEAHKAIFLWLLVGLFGASHCFLIFHIDHRYLTITVPSLLLLAASFAGWLVAQAARRGPVAGRSALLLVGVAVLATMWPQLERLRAHPPRDDRAVTAMRALGEHFREHGGRPKFPGNRQPHIDFHFPEQHPLRPEDRFLVAYFTHTSWVNGLAEGPFPRGRFYSYRDRPHDYLYLPAARIDQFPGARRRIIARHDNPILGEYYLVSGR